MGASPESWQLVNQPRSAAGCPGVRRGIEVRARSGGRQLLRRPRLESCRRFCARPRQLCAAMGPRHYSDLLPGVMCRSPRNLCQNRDGWKDAISPIQRAARARPSGTQNRRSGWRCYIAIAAGMPRRLRLLKAGLRCHRTRIWPITDTTFLVRFTERPSLSRKRRANSAKPIKRGPTGRPQRWNTRKCSLRWAKSEWPGAYKVACLS